tara:strand:+ start:5566 stop:6348 length:783 start_codon:yes stop_codon:yes gene_type:complete
MGGSCGLQFSAKYEENMEFPSSPAMVLGQWFEYKCTGQTTKFGHIPVPVRLKPKKLTKKQIDDGFKQEDVVGELGKKYTDALHHVEAFKMMIEENEYEIVDTGLKLHDKIKGTTGDVDIVVRKKGEDKVRFIDTKFSGLLDNKWEDMGWADESLETKDKLMIQAVHYKMLGKAKYGYYPEFYFWVFSSTNTTDRKNIRVEVNPERFDEHDRTIKMARDFFDQSKARGWIPRPSPKLCGACPLASKCEHKVELPIEQIVYY